MIKWLPSDKAAGPDGITHRILQTSGEQAIDMISFYIHAHHMGSGNVSRGLSVCPHATHLQMRGQRQILTCVLQRHLPTQHPHKLLEGLLEARLSKFTELNDTLNLSQQGSRVTRQTSDAIYAFTANIQQRSQYGFASCCCFKLIDFATAYLFVHRKHLGLTLKKYEITGKMWHLFKENPKCTSTGSPCYYWTKRLIDIAFITS